MFHPSFAISALFAGIDKDTDANTIANFKLGNLRTDYFDDSYDFMSWNHWEKCRSPFLSSLMDI
jgi:hypothetical protein